MSIVLKALKAEEGERSAPAGASVGGHYYFRSHADSLRSNPKDGHKKGMQICLIVLILLGALLYSLGVFEKSKVVPAPEIKHFPNISQSTAPSKIERLNKEAVAKKDYSAGNYKASLKVYTDLIEKNPSEPQYFNNIGLIYLKLGDYDRSELAFKEATRLKENCATCNNNLGLLNTVKGQSKKAESYFRQASSMSLTYPDPYFNLGVLYEKNGDLGQAIASYEQFLRRSPDKQAKVYKRVQNHLETLWGAK